MVGKRTGFAAAVILAVAAATAAAAPTQVLVTVDVESKGSLRLPQQMDAVCADGTRCGLMEAVRQLQRRGWTATLFLNVYERKQLGDAEMQRIVRRLQDAGQDVELHTHPDAGFDPARWAMHQYSLDEQDAIVRDGVQALSAFTGKPVVAHRAGAYAADERTLVALERNGVLIDSSRFWTDTDSRLDATGLPRNLPGRHGGLFEIPVTVFVRSDRPALFGSLLPPVTTVRKIDPNWLTSGAEMRSAVDAALAAGVPYITLFLHSFSFMREAASGQAPEADHAALARFAEMLDYVASRQLPVVSTRQIAEAGVVMASPSTADIVPTVTVHVALPRYVLRSIKPHMRLVAAALLLAVAVAGVWIISRRTRALRGGGQSPAAAGASVPFGARPR